MQNFRHNLTPVEVKIFLKTIEEFTDNLFIRYCHKVPQLCPRCGNGDICQGGAVSFFSSSFDKVTHEIKACLRCGYKEMTMVLTIEKL
jgi:ribosomal protein S27AE